MSRRIRVEAADVTGGLPDPGFVSMGRGTSEDTTVLTDSTGKATFSLRGPTSDERLDTVTFEAIVAQSKVIRLPGVVAPS